MKNGRKQAFLPIADPILCPFDQWKTPLQATLSSTPFTNARLASVSWKQMPENWSGVMMAPTMWRWRLRADWCLSIGSPRRSMEYGIRTEFPALTKGGSYCAVAAVGGVAAKIKPGENKRPGLAGLNCPAGGLHSPLVASGALFRCKIAKSHRTRDCSLPVRTKQKDGKSGETGHLYGWHGISEGNFPHAERNRIFFDRPKPSTPVRIPNGIFDGSSPTVAR